MANLTTYQESKISLSPTQFLQDVIIQTKIAEVPSYEAKKQAKLFCAAQIEFMKLDYILEDWEKLELEELILSEFKRLSFNELYYAFKLERYGSLYDPTPSYGRFDTVYVSQVLRKYKKWKQNYRKTHNLPIGVQHTENEISEDEKKKLLIDGVMECYDYYKEHYLIMDGKTYVYDVLYDIDLLPKDPESKFKAYEEASEVIKMELSSLPKRSLKDRSEFQRIKEQLELKKSDLVVRKAKQIVVGQYFRKTKKDELLETLIKRL